MAAQGKSLIGQSLRRVEDSRLVLGRGSYVGDIQPPGLLDAVIVRSEVAHARLDSVELSFARSVRGVADAFSAVDITGYHKPIPSVLPVPAELEAFRQFPLAGDTVRYVGEPVAVVVADDRYIAEDAASKVLIEYVPLPVVSTVDVEGTQTHVALFEGHSNVVSLRREESGEDVDSALAQAPVVFQEAFRIHRHTALPLETRGLIVRPDPDSGVTVWGIAKRPHQVRGALGTILDLPPQMIRVEPVDIGGGFGVRGEVYPEDALVAMAAVRTGRPVRWLEDRREHLLAVNHSRDMTWTVRAGLTDDGELLALDGTVWVDMGAYVRPAVTLVAQLAVAGLLGPYRIRAFRCQAHCVFTNKMGVGTVRAPGAFEATFVRERLLDLIAQKLRLDPISFRLRNLLREDDYPRKTGLHVLGAEVIHDAGVPDRALEVLADALVKGRWKQTEQRASFSPRARVGVGVAVAAESTGAGSFELARLAALPSGCLSVAVPTSSMGQGHETVLAQIAAEAAGVPIECVSVHEGNPAHSPAGVGTFGSRSAVMAGNAVWKAGLELSGLIRQVDPGRSLTLHQVVRLASEQGIALEVAAEFRSPGPTYAYGAHGAVVEVDPDTGNVKILHHVVVADVGRAVNPRIVAGQLHGGAIQGMGGALFEELRYSQEGQPLSTTLLDYLLPSATDAPNGEVILLDDVWSTRNPLGIKGAGELGATGAGAALANAVADALGAMGSSITALPLRPESVWRATVPATSFESS